MRPRDLAAGCAAAGILAVLLTGGLNGVDAGALVRRSLASALLCGAAGGLAAAAWPRPPAPPKETVAPPKGRG